MKLVLTFDQGGIGRCLYSELINLPAIGVLTISRATTIEFNPTEQLWEVRDTGNQILYTNASRQTCLEWEHQHFNQ
jgi:hypothetical protein